MIRDRPGSPSTRLRGTSSSTWGQRCTGPGGARGSGPYAGLSPCSGSATRSGASIGQSPRGSLSGPASAAADNLSIPLGHPGVTQPSVAAIIGQHRARRRGCGRWRLPAAGLDAPKVRLSRFERYGRRMPRLVSLYTGAGGLDLGLETAGFEVAAAVEKDRSACATLRANRQWPLFEADVHDVTSRMLLEAADAEPGEIDLLIGGPPCQPFSKSAYWARGGTRRLDDPRADTLTAWLRVLRDIRPKAFLLENVSGLAYQRKAEGLRLLKTTIDAINESCGTDYSFQWQVLNAANYGVPQVRERVFIVGARDGTEFKFPGHTHADPNCMQTSDGTEDHEYWTTAWDAIGDLDPGASSGLAPTGKWARLLPSIPEGKNYLYHTPRGDGMPLFGWRTRYWAFLVKLAKNRPSWTIQAQPGSATGPFHWNNRRLSTHELCRLQTFPDTYCISGSRTEAQRQVGNAVPPAMGELLGREVRHQILRENDPVPDGRLRLIPLARRPIPKPQPPEPVPEEFHHLAGDHAGHPGQGKGPAAKGAAWTLKGGQ